MEIKRRRRNYFNLFKKLIITLICFCIIVFILFNYICYENQCYWRSNRFDYSQNKFYRSNYTLNYSFQDFYHIENVQSNTRPNDHLSKESNTNEKDQFQDIEKIKNLKFSKNRIKLQASKNTIGTVLSSMNQLESNKSDQLIGSKRKSKLVNQLDQSNEKHIRFKYLNLINESSKNRSLLNLNQVTYDQIASGDDHYKFNLYKDDVLIFLHIQKTGGTSLGKRLVHDLLLDKPCECVEGKKHCSCIRPELNEFNQTESNRNYQSNNSQIIRMNKIDTNDSFKLLEPNVSRSKNWLLSRYSTGWICGLHADWTQLQFCADNSLNRIEKVELKRRFFFITLLRDPVSRFLSEFGHVRRGATWSASRYACSNEFMQDDNNEIDSDELILNQTSFSPNFNRTNNNVINRQFNSNKYGKCYSGDNWSGVDLVDFMNCKQNLAINRQTRMLSDLTKIGCSNDANQTEYNRKLLESAKYNLKRLAYFGILEYQKISQFIFESTFDLKFMNSFIQLNKTHSTQLKPDSRVVEQIKELNYLDMKLYDYAKQILFDRFERIKKYKSFELFEKSKKSSLDNLKLNLKKFPELKWLLQKNSKYETSVNQTKF